MADGTSDAILVVDEGITARKPAKASTVQGWEVTDGKESFMLQAPDLTDDNIRTIKIHVNPYPEFAFEKIVLPDYGPEGCLSRYTGYPANRPDGLKDYYFIALMRLVDKMMNDRPTSVIKKTTKDSPKPSN